MINLEDTNHIDINNVAHWFYTVNDQEDYSLSDDFPCVLSPWRGASFYFRYPRLINNGGKFVKSPGWLAAATWRTTVITLEAENEDVRKDTGGAVIEAMASRLKGSKVEMTRDDTYQDGHQRAIEHLENNDTQCKWLQYFRQELEIGGEYSPLFLAYGYIDSRGALIGDSLPIIPSAAVVEFIAEYDQTGAGLRTSLFPVLFALSLLHCKNVELIDMPISRQQRRLAERKNKPLIQYKTLVIEPFKKQVRNEARQLGQSEIQRALHIARGHFRTYTEEKPLFGRVSGTFWIPMHLRGNKSKGEVHKDYEVRTEE